MTMQLRFSIRSDDPNLIKELEKEVPEGISVRQKLTIKEMVNPPIDFIVTNTKDIAVQVFAS